VVTPTRRSHRSSCAPVRLRFSLLVGLFACTLQSAPIALDASAEVADEAEPVGYLTWPALESTADIGPDFELDATVRMLRSAVDADPAFDDNISEVNSSDVAESDGDLGNVTTTTTTLFVPAVMATVSLSLIIRTSDPFRFVGDPLVRKGIAVAISRVTKAWETWIEVVVRMGTGAARRLSLPSGTVIADITISIPALYQGMLTPGGMAQLLREAGPEGLTTAVAYAINELVVAAGGIPYILVVEKMSEVLITWLITTTLNILAPPSDGSGDDFPYVPVVAGSCTGAFTVAGVGTSFWYNKRRKAARRLLQDERKEAWVENDTASPGSPSRTPVAEGAQTTEAHVVNMVEARSLELSSDAREGDKSSSEEGAACSENNALRVAASAKEESAPSACAPSACAQQTLPGYVDGDSGRPSPIATPPGTVPSDGHSTKSSEDVDEGDDFAEAEALLSDHPYPVDASQEVQESIMPRIVPLHSTTKGLELPESYDPPDVPMDEEVDEQWC